MTIKLLTEQHLEFQAQKGAAMLARVYTCKNTTMLEITCHGSYVVGVQQKNSQRNDSFEHQNQILKLMDKQIYLIFS